MDLSPPSTPPRDTLSGTQSDTPKQRQHIKYNDHQNESKNLDELGNTIDILRTNNLKDKVVERGVCYFGTTTAGIKTYLKSYEREYHKWTLPKEVKDRLFDLTNPDNYKTVLELRDTFEKPGNITDEAGNVIGNNQEGLIYFTTLLKTKVKVNDSDENEFERYSSASKDDIFFKLLKVKLNKFLKDNRDLFPENQEEFIGTYTKQGSHHSHAEVVIWDTKILGNIHQGEDYENNKYQYDTIKAPQVAPEAAPASALRKRKRGEYSEEQSPPFIRQLSFSEGGKRKTQKKTKKKSKTSNKKSKRKNTKCLHKKKGGSYKKKTKKQRRNKKKASLKKK